MTRKFTKEQIQTSRQTQDHKTKKEKKREKNQYNNGKRTRESQQQKQRQTTISSVTLLSLPVITRIDGHWVILSSLIDVAKRFTEDCLNICR